MSDQGGKFKIGQIVQHVVGCDGQHYKGYISAREVYTDAHGTREWWHVRWMRPDGAPESKTEMFPGSELETVPQ